MSEYANMFVASAMIVTLYFGGWTLPFVTFTGNLGALLSLGVFLAKVFAWVFVFIWVRWTLPRFRYDQLMALGWKVLLPLSVANLLAVAWWVARSKGAA
jgi:NADH-quinone oxidoreductase subunit H